MPNELAFELDGFDLHVIDFADDPWIRVIREAAEFFLQIDGFHCIPRIGYRPCTISVTAARTRCVVSGLDVSEYTRRRFSVPEARTSTQPISPRWSLMPSMSSRRITGQSSSF